MIVVADAGPLIYLSGAGQLDLLRALFDRVVIPRAVFDEVVINGAGLTGAGEVERAQWIEVHEIDPDATLLSQLGAGESAAIPLAAQLGAVLLCDDGAARAEARRRGVLVLGSLGTLLRAKRAGEIDEIQSVITRMTDLGMYVSQRLVDAILDAAGEASQSGR